MSSREVIGKVLQTLEETNVQWEIADFITITLGKPGTSFCSPSFAFSDALCHLQIDKSGDEVGLYFCLNEKSDNKMSCKMSLKTRFGKLEYTRECTEATNSHQGYGWRAFFELQFLPEGILTVLCNVRRVEPRVVEIPRLERLKKACSDLKKFLTKKTDLVFKLKDRDVQVHKVILENRSEYFQKMFSHNMVENRTGIVTIDDCDSELFQQILSYMYSGEVDELCVGNMCQLYFAADKYLLADMKKTCASFIEKNISADLFCDVLVAANMRNDSGLMKILKEFFIQKSKILLKTEKWKSFRKENSQVACELLETIVEENAHKLLGSGREIVKSEQ